MDLKQSIRTIPDYPIEGVRFRDITTIVNNPTAFRFCIDRLHQRYLITNFDKLAIIESRGFIFGSTLGYLLGLPVVVIRKEGKLPGDTIKASYDLEYGQSTLEVHKDAIKESDRIVIIDDLIATGGTYLAANELISNLGGVTVECATVIELVDLKGREKIKPLRLFSLVSFHEDEV